jgi:hypothetical protein
MGSIDKKDLQAFGRVLSILADSFMKEPEKWLIKLESILDLSNKTNGKPREELNVKRLEDFQLYEVAKLVTKDELVIKLKQFNIDELRLILKENKLGYSKLKSVNALAEFIADQANKRTTDVFQHHEK